MPKVFSRINDANSLSWKVEKAIKEAIISGTYQPREKLPGEIELSNQFGVSRPVVREAMMSLKSRGFLEIRRGKGGGSYVSNLDQLFFKENFTDLIRLKKIQVDDLVQARLFIEPEVVKLVVANATEQDLNKIQKNLIEFEETTDPDIRARLVTEYHKLIGRPCGNPLYSVLMDSIMDFYEAYMRVIKPSSQLLNNIEDHSKIYQAIKERDTEKAVKLTKRHITTTIDNMIKMEKTYLRLVEKQSA
jgi:GntR family transcriptional repressor for pyruvate dehydrogenase complex